jgi:cyanophycinase-like exopeptidase
VDDVKGPQEVFRGENVVDEGTAHVIDFVDKVRVQLEGAAMVVDPMDELVMRLARTYACEYVNVVSLPFQGRRQLRDMGCNSSHGNRVKGLPG